MELQHLKLQEYLSELSAGAHLNSKSFHLLENFVNRYASSTSYTSGSLRDLFPEVAVLAITDKGVERLDTTPSSVYPRDVQQHPHLLRPRLIFKMVKHTYIVYRVPGMSLREIIGFHSQDFTKEQRLFVLYQLRRLLSDFCRVGVTLGNVTLDNIYLEENVWLQLAIMPMDTSNIQHKNPPHHMVDQPHFPIHKTILDTPLMVWARGQMSNYDYLMTLNEMAGRQLGNPNLHFLMPWVTDFEGSYPETGLRDLRKTKQRLKKGDEQLDMTFQSTIKHHITNIFSDLTYYMYKARRTPIPLLKQYIREKYIPDEYPSSMERLYKWTSDECIPEFFTNPDILISIHEDMGSITLPEWAKTPTEFIVKHRELLESHHVSRYLHLWIDLTFGYRLSGEAGIQAKNVALPLANTMDREALSGWKDLQQHGIAQLFFEPHPPRATHYNNGDTFKENNSMFKNNIDSYNLTQNSGSSNDVLLFESKCVTNIDTKHYSKPMTRTSSQSSISNLEKAAVQKKPIDAVVTFDAFTAELQQLEQRHLFSSKHFKITSISVVEHRVEKPTSLYLPIMMQELSQLGKLFLWTLSDLSYITIELQANHQMNHWLSVLDSVVPDILPPYCSLIHNFILSFYRCDVVEEQFALSLLVARADSNKQAVHIMVPYFRKLMDYHQLTKRLAPLLKYVWLRVGYRGFGHMFSKKIIDLYEYKPLRQSLCNTSFITTIKLVMGESFVINRLLTYYVEALSSSNVEFPQHPQESSEKIIAELIASIRLVCATLGAIQASKGVLPIVYRTCHKEEVPIETSWTVLETIGDVFGDAFVLSQYPPLILSSVRSLTSITSKKNMPIIARVITIFEMTIKKLLLSRGGPSVLEECGREFSEILTRLLQAPAENNTFTSADRSEYCEHVLRYILDTICHLTQCIIKPLWEEYIVPPLNVYFQAFENVEAFSTYESRTIFQVFHSPALAALVYTRMCQVCGQETMRKCIKRADLVEQLTYTYLQTQQELDDAILRPMGATHLSVPPISSPHPLSLTISRGHSPVKSESSPSLTSFGSGGRIPTAIKQLRSGGFNFSRSMGELKSAETVELDAKRGQHSTNFYNTDAHSSPIQKMRSELRFNWVKFLSTTGQLDTNQINFQDLLLYSYSGHAGLQCLAVDRQMRLIASGSKDKTVKLWSLNVHKHLGEQFQQFSDCTATYHGHQHQVRDVCFLSGHVASSDGSIDIWDAEYVKITRRITAAHEFVSVLPLYDTRSLTGFTRHNFIYMIDTRSKADLLLWWPSVVHSSTIRVAIVSPDGNLLATGFSNGMISILELRTGSVQAVWKGHEHEISQLCFVNADLLMTTSLNDASIYMWNIKTFSLNTILRLCKTGEVCRLRSHENQVVALYSGNTLAFSVYGRVTQTNAVRFDGHIAKTTVTDVHYVPSDQAFVLSGSEGQIFVVG